MQRLFDSLRMRALNIDTLLNWKVGVQQEPSTWHIYNNLPQVMQFLLERWFSEPHDLHVTLPFWL